MRNKTFLKNFEDFVLKCNKARGIKMLNLHKNLNKLLFHKYINYNPYLLSVFKYAPVRHVTGNDQDYLRKIPRAVVQISALL